VMFLVGLYTAAGFIFLAKFGALPTMDLFIAPEMYNNPATASIFSFVHRCQLLASSFGFFFLLSGPAHAC
jgi:hypothetical protein